jgi:hypothetical protein
LVIIQALTRALNRAALFAGRALAPRLRLGNAPIPFPGRTVAFQRRGSEREASMQAVYVVHGCASQPGSESDERL